MYTRFTAEIHTTSDSTAIHRNNYCAETESPIAYFLFAGVLGSSDKRIKRVAEATYEQVGTADTLAKVASSEGTICRANFGVDPVPSIQLFDHKLLHI